MQLFLDDCPRRTAIWIDRCPDGITTTRSKSMISLLKLNHDVKYLFLDHDLDGDVPGYDPLSPAVNTGMEVVEWLEKNKKNITQIIVHSMNSHAAPVMEKRLKAAGYWVVGCPFYDLIPQLGRD